MWNDSAFAYLWCYWRFWSTLIFSKKEYYNPGLISPKNSADEAEQLDFWLSLNNGDDCFKYATYSGGKKRHLFEQWKLHIQSSLRSELQQLGGLLDTFGEILAQLAKFPMTSMSQVYNW